MRRDPAKAYSRRSALKVLGLGVAGSLLGGSARGAKLPPEGTRSADVIVMGAGFAGLAAGRALTAAGRRVVILDARDRTGNDPGPVPARALRARPLGGHGDVARVVRLHRRDPLWGARGGASRSPVGLGCRVGRTRLPANPTQEKIRCLRTSKARATNLRSSST